MRITRKSLGLTGGAGVVIAAFSLVMAFASPASAGDKGGPPPGACPDGYTKLTDGFSGKDFTAGEDYSSVILVGGPPGVNNQDPDGRNKPFDDVAAGVTVSRVAHDISHVCVIVAEVPDTETTTIEYNVTGSCALIEGVATYTYAISWTGGNDDTYTIVDDTSSESPFIGALLGESGTISDFWVSIASEIGVTIGDGDQQTVTANACDVPPDDDKPPVPPKKSQG